MKIICMFVVAPNATFCLFLRDKIKSETKKSPLSSVSQLGCVSI